MKDSLVLSLSQFFTIDLIINTATWLFFNAVSPYYPESQFSMSSLSRLEDAGIGVVTSLAKVHNEVMSAAGITLDVESQVRMYMIGSKDIDFLEIIISRWESGCSRYPPTWKPLHDILNKLNLKHLSQQIEAHFGENGISYKMAGLLLISKLRCR